MPYYFSWFMYCLQISPFISIYQTAIGIMSPVEFANKASHYQYVMGKLWPHSAVSNYLYLSVWVNLCILFILYFKLSFLNRAEIELKCNRLYRKYTICILSYTDSWCIALLAAIYSAIILIKWVTVLAEHF